MNPGVIVVDYIGWHYGAAFRSIVSIWTNLMWFAVHFFSIPMLLRTLFSPWRRVQEEYHVRNGLERFFEALVVNIMTRIVGALMRLVIILCGFIVLVVMFAGIVAFVIFWLIAPFVFAYLIFLGIVYLF